MLKGPLFQQPLIGHGVERHAAAIAEIGVRIGCVTRLQNIKKRAFHLPLDAKGQVGVILEARLEILVGVRRRLKAFHPVVADEYPSIPQIEGFEVE